MADQKDMICWERASTFSIGVQLKTPGGRVHSPSEELIELDTGYEGEVLVPYDLYVEMELYGWEYPEIFWATGRTVSGEILHMPLSYGYLVIPRWGREIRVSIETFVGNSEFLIGRALIRRYRFLLDGPGNRTCLLLEDEISSVL